MADLGPAELVAGIVLVALTAYVLLGGADFGGGVWDLLASGPRKREQRALIAEAIGPIWEANHVWLILVIVVLFTCFPVAFARLAIGLHIPLSLMLIGIVLRGSAFTFRSHYGHSGEHDDTAGTSQHWGRIFAIASVGTPVMLGLCVSALAAGTLRPPGRAGFYEAYVAPWLTPFGVGVGLLTLALFAFLAAVYLTVEAREWALQEDFRRRALGAAAAVLVTAFGADHRAVGAGAAPGDRRGRRHRDLGALEPPLPPGPRGGSRPGLADPLGLGAGPVPLPDPARSHHPGCRSAAHHPGPVALDARSRHARALPVADLPLPRLQARAPLGPLYSRTRVPRPMRPLTLSLSPSGGEGIETAPSPSARERGGVRVAHMFTHDPG